LQISGKGSQILKLRSLAGDITRRIPDTLTASTYAIHLDPTRSSWRCRKAQTCA